jgi:hypothetical protein
LVADTPIVEAPPIAPVDEVTASVVAAAPPGLSETEKLATTAAHPAGTIPF